jgi:hypothetical protein
VNEVHTWYKSDVPNTVKLHPKAEAIYRDHAAILQEEATQAPKLTANKILTPDQAEGIRAKYKQLSEESAANVQELSVLANGTTMSEAEQLIYVSNLAAKQAHQLALVRYYTKKTAATIAQKEQEETTKHLMMQEFGHE